VQEQLRRLLIVGAGGHGRVAADCADCSKEWDSIAFLDDRWPDLTSNLDWPVIGTLKTLPDILAPNDHLFVAIGDGASRMRILRELKASGRQIATIIHPRAVVSSRAKIGAGTLVVAGAVVNVGTRTGEGCIINTGATVDHDCQLAAGVHICPGAHVAGTCTIGEESWVGVGASVRQGIRLGARVLIGAGAAVVSDFSDGEAGLGVPARVVKRKD